MEPHTTLMHSEIVSAKTPGWYPRSLHLLGPFNPPSFPPLLLLSDPVPHILLAHLADQPPGSRDMGVPGKEALSRAQLHAPSVPKHIEDSCWFAPLSPLLPTSSLSGIMGLFQLNAWRVALGKTWGPMLVIEP